MSTTESLQEALDTMQRVLDAGPIGDSLLAGETPCSQFEVEDLLEHVLETHEMLLAAVGGEPAARTGRISQDHAALGEASVAQWSSRGVDGTIDLGGNELPAAFGLSLQALEAYIHAWDLAVSTARPFKPTTELTEQMWDFAQSFINDDMRGDFEGAPYGPAVEVDPDAELSDRLIALSGRDPRRTVG